MLLLSYTAIVHEKIMHGWGAVSINCDTFILTFETYTDSFISLSPN